VNNFAWPEKLTGKATGQEYFFIKSSTGLCARYLGPYGEVYITQQDLKDKVWSK
jgi:hypothetical protein